MLWPRQGVLYASSKNTIGVPGDLKEAISYMAKSNDVSEVDIICRMLADPPKGLEKHTETIPVNNYPQLRAIADMYELTIAQLLEQWAASAIAASDDPSLQKWKKP